MEAVRSQLAAQASAVRAGAVSPAGRASGRNKMQAIRSQMQQAQAAANRVTAPQARVAATVPAAQRMQRAQPALTQQAAQQRRGLLESGG